jgi:hypothetical protein
MQHEFPNKFSNEFPDKAPNKAPDKAPDKAFFDKWFGEYSLLLQEIKLKLIDKAEAADQANMITKKYLSQGHIPTLAILNAHLRHCHTLTAANEILDVFKPFKLHYNYNTYNALIRVSPDFKTASAFYDMLLVHYQQPSTYTLHGFLRFCKTLTQARTIISQLRKFPRVVLTDETYEMLFMLTRNKTERDELLAEMRVARRVLSENAYDRLIFKATTYDDAMGLYHEMRSRDIKPSFKTFWPFLKLVTNRDELHLLEQSLVKEKIEVDSKWEEIKDNTLIGIQENNSLG